MITIENTIEIGILITFGELYEYEGTQLKFVSRVGLISMKQLAGRFQDLVDIENFFD